MARRALSAEKWVRVACSHAGSEVSDENSSGLDPMYRRMERGAFATLAYVRLLDALGWTLSASVRHETERHAPLQCCIIARDGRREVAAFGYTSLTVPNDIGCAALVRAKSYVEWFLDRLGEDRGLLLQNMPLIAFGGARKDKIAVFGGWQFWRGVWAPFLLGSDGLAGVFDQGMLFADNTAPHYMAEIHGHASEAFMPRIMDLVSAIEALDRNEAEDAAAPSPRHWQGTLKIEHIEAGWFTAQTVQPDARNVSMFKHTHQSIVGQMTGAVSESSPFEVDEFRFHKFGVGRK